MVNYWVKEFRRLIWLILLFSFIGWYFSIFWPMISLGLSAYVVWTFAQLWRIRNWLLSSENSPVPQSFGLWGDINDSIYSLYKAQLREKERLNQSIRYLHDSFASLSDAVVMLDSNGGIDWCNKASERLLGLRYPEDQNQLLINFLRAPEFVEYFETSDYKKPLEILSALDGKTHLKFVVTRFGHGNRLVFASDITEFVNAQKIRRDFLANVSHELRTPLTVISGYLDNISMSPQIAENKVLCTAIEQMSSQAERMELLIKDLTDLSRIESKPVADLNKKVDLIAVLEEAKTMTLASLRSKNSISLSCDNQYLIFGSQKELHSVFSNLLVNAVKYSPGDAQVEVKVWSVENKLFVSVKDQGMGIEAHHIPRLTERFYRVDGSRNSETGGTGLGLAIVKHVLNRHDAQLIISSEIGKGSEFICEFPQNRFKIIEKS